MSQDLNANIVIVVFAMPGCPACEDYIPRLYQQIGGFQKLGHPFVIYELGKSLKPGQIPILVYDASARDPGVQAFADQHGVSGLPTTLLLPKVGFPAKYEGGLGNDQIYALLNAAIATNK